jgi:hypothetical protein
MIPPNTAANVVEIAMDLAHTVCRQRQADTMANRKGIAVQGRSNPYKGDPLPRIEATNVINTPGINAPSTETKRTAPKAGGSSPD